LLARIIRIQADLVDQLFNSSEKRLARILLLAAEVGEQGQADPLIPKIPQEVWRIWSAQPAPVSTVL
jgi:hypothetical protein